MTRFFIISAFVLAAFAFSGSAVADDIGVGKPGGSTTNSVATSGATTDDDIGVGNESWYELMIGWFGG